MAVYCMVYEYNNGPFVSNKRCRNIIADSEWDAKQKLFKKLRESEKRQGRILHFIDCDFWKVEKVLNDYNNLWEVSC